MGQDEAGVWTAPSGARIAWFPDPDGNVLSLTAFAPLALIKRFVAGSGPKLRQTS